MRYFITPKKITTHLRKVGALETPISKFHQDPVRTSNYPDTLGSFVDPMSGRGSYSIGFDVTNTGA